MLQIFCCLFLKSIAFHFASYYKGFIIGILEIKVFFMIKLCKF